MKIRLKIVQSSAIWAEKQCENLNEKELVKAMMLRRRLTRASKIALYLASKVGYTHEPIVFGTAYGEVNATVDIVKSIYQKSAISPTAFQNSVHNTPVSYLSIVSENTAEITTVSDLFDTSLSVLKTGAIKALRGQRLLLLNVDAFNFDGVKEINQCKVAYLESGVALMVEVTEEEATLHLENRPYDGISPSLWQMLEIYHQSQNIENPIIEVVL